MELTDYIGQGILFGILLFITVFAILSKKDNPNITKGLPFFILTEVIILYNAYVAGGFFGHFVQAWENAFGG